VAGASQRRLAAILIADIVGYSRLIECDEVATLAAVRQLNRDIIQPLLAANDGRLVKMMGDGLLAEFASVVNAVRCAVDLQKAVASAQAEAPPARRIVFRAGINLGDVMVEDDDLFGDGVNIAARLQQLCEPGGVLISGTAYDQLQGKIDLQLDHAGEQRVKNIARPVRTYRVRLDGSAPAWRLRLRGEARRRRWGAVLLIALLAAAATTWGASQWLTVPLAPRHADLAVAVLPFTNLGDDQEENWLGEGIAEDIMTAVSRFRDLTVIARNSSFRYSGEQTDVQAVGRELNAEFLLQGSVRRASDRVRISVQLVDTSSGATRWAERYDRPFADIFEVQDEITDHVAAQLVVHAREAAVSRLQSVPAANLEAYELVLRARKAYRANTQEALVEARELAEQAIALAPDYAPAWAQLSGVLVTQFHLGSQGEGPGGPDLLRQAHAAAERAVVLDPTYSSGHSVLGFALVSAGDLDAGLEALRKALILNPNDASIFSLYANALDRAGSHREAVEVWERHERFDPFRTPLNLALKARAHILLGEFEPALALTRSCAERAPQLQYCFIYLAIAANELGLEDEARAAAQRVLEVDPKFTVERLLSLLRLRPDPEEKLAVFLRRAGFPNRL
jgi:TolB-like protein/class 3 adenylate cyclase